MSLFEDEDGPPKKAVGGLSMLGQLKGKFTPVGSKQSDDSWKRIWSARSTFPFSLPAGSSCEVVLLEDISIFVASAMLTGWAQDKNFPKLDYVRSAAFNDSGDSTGEHCVISEVTGLSPTVIGVSLVLDMRPFKDKDGVDHKFSIRPLLIKSETVLTQLQTISKHHQRPLAYARMTVTRSMDSKSPASGDSWFCESFLEPAKISAKIPNFEAERAKFDLKLGYPRPSVEEAKKLLRLHVAVCEKNKDKGNKVTNYNKEAWARLNDQTLKDDVGTKSAFDDMVEEPKRAAVKETKTTFDLDELDDVLGG